MKVNIWIYRCSNETDRNTIAEKFYVRTLLTNIEDKKNTFNFQVKQAEQDRGYL